LSEYNNYLAYIFAHTSDPSIRMLAGITLKNNLGSFEMNEWHRQCTLHALQDPLLPIQQTAGSIISKVVEKNFSILSDLSPLLNSTVPHVLLGVLAAVDKICEDSSEYCF
jgi:hypothetical protein